MKHLCAYAVLLLSVATTSCLFSQSTSATISGLVTDPAGRAIPAADIQIVDDATAIQYPVKTNDVGIYSIPVLPPGRYHMQVSKIGFKTIIKPDIVLNVQSALALNFSLPVGATSESVTVQGSSSLLNTTDASVSTVIDRQFVQNMPLNGRSFQDLISMTPGVVTQSLLSVDALQEFRVASSTYSAEYGRSPGRQLSFLTRSGTNDLHGTIFARKYGT